MTLVEEMEAYAVQYDVPIMQQEGITFMCDFIKEHHIQSILEIGSAIGYSAIRMASNDDKIRITTIEKDETRYEKAKQYIQQSPTANQICIKLGDALEADLSGEYDLIFIDAAKAQYIKFFERYEPYLKKGGFIISDNLKFHGFVEHPEDATSRNLRQLVGKIKRFVEYLKQREDFDTVFLEQGDGIGISQKR